MTLTCHCGAPLGSLLDECATPACMTAELDAEADHDRAVEDR